MKSELKSHGRKQIELKCSYPVTENKTSLYNLNLWIFIPGSLGFVQNKDSVGNFFSNIKCLTRFSPARISLSVLLNPDYEPSPLNRIEKGITSAGMKKDIESDKIIYELRSLANIVSSELSEIENIISDTIKKGQFPVIRSSLKKHISEIKDFIEKWRSLYHLFLRSNIKVKIRNAYLWTDESLSLSIEQFFYKIYGIVKDIEDSESVIKKIFKIMDNEIKHRKNMGYLYLSKKTDEEMLEHRIYRDSILKKWAQSVLYLTKENTGHGKRWEHIFAGIAAATAMSVAAAATILDQIYFPGRQIPWIIIVITAYIFKDRIKEVLRKLLVNTFKSKVTDELVHLIDQSNSKKIGKLKSGVRFLKTSSIPRNIYTMRYSQKNPFRQFLPEEAVINFSREVFIQNQMLKNYHKRVENITDIIRIKFDDLFTHMDEPEKKTASFAWNPPREITGKRVYHVYVITEINEEKTNKQTSGNYRLILSRNGIERIERI